ncbi:MAG: hypothetical protein KC506_00375, partial [Nanoarchaeota archaeon]|nr:hypothetical protein [Nanoarchaeota archaeon]
MKKQIIVLIIIALLTLIFVNLKNENSQEKIIIPVVAHQIMDPSGQYTTSRSEDNIKETINEANRIWSQANIEFQLREIRQDNVSFNAIPSALTGNHMELYNTLNFNPDEVNVFFAGTLTGLNGLTLVKINSVLITDNPTSSGGRA